MLILVTGGSGSGKSEYAENTAVRLAKEEGLPLYYIAAMKPCGEEGRRRVERHPLYYIAAMKPCGEEGRRRVERHRRLRAGKGFETWERYVDLKGLALPKRGVALLECLSNLTANEMFEPEGAGDRTVESVLAGVRSLGEKTAHLVVVTNDIFSDGMTYDEVTALYQDPLGRRRRIWSSSPTISFLTE